MTTLALEVRACTAEARVVELEKCVEQWKEHYNDKFNEWDILLDENERLEARIKELEQRISELEAE